MSFKEESYKYKLTLLLWDYIVHCQDALSTKNSKQVCLENMFIEHTKNLDETDGIRTRNLCRDRAVL